MILKQLFFISFMMMVTVSSFAKDLLKACEAGETQSVFSQLQKGVNVNSVDEQGRTCLMLAIEFDHSKIANILLENKNIDVNKKDKDGVTALWLAVEFDRSKVIELLLKKNAESLMQNSNLDNSFHLLARTKDLKILESLRIEAGNNLNSLLNQKNSLGETPLMTAVVFRNKDFIVQLLKLGADKTIKNNEGKSALMMAKEIKNKKIIAILEK